MFVSTIWIILTWIMSGLLLANSLVILINIFDFPATGIRHLVSVTSALGVVTGLMFVALWISRYLGLSKHG